MHSGNNDQYTLLCISESFNAITLIPLPWHTEMVEVERYLLLKIYSWLYVWTVEHAAKRGEMLGRWQRGWHNGNLQILFHNSSLLF